MTIYSIYGYGKCKTESAIGITIRSVANKENVLFAQFLKDGSSTEVDIIKKIATYICSDTQGITLPKNVDDNVVSQCSNLFTEILEEMATGKYNIAILDEVLVAVDIGILSFKLLTMLVSESKKYNVDLYLTGRVRNKNNRLLVQNISDCVTDARCVKHQFDTYCPSCNNTFSYSYTYCPDCGSELIKSVACKKGRDY